MRPNIVDDRPMIFEKTGWFKTADYDNDRYLRAIEHLANAYNLLKDQVTSLEVGPMFGDDLFIRIR